MVERLTTLARVKEYLGLAQVSTSDALLSRLIDGASAMITNYVNRNYWAAHLWNEYYDGRGGNTMMPRNWPVVSVTSLNMEGVALSAAAGVPPTNGWMLESDTGGGPQRITLRGWSFPRCRSGINLVYTSGYVTSDQAVAAALVTTSRLWLADSGVTYNGAALQLVSSGPAAGQYSVDSAGNYSFATADAGHAVVISYSYVPADVEQCCLEMVASKYKAKDRLDISTESLGGQQTVGYTQRDMSPWIKTTLQPFMSTVPI